MRSATPTVTPRARRSSSWPSGSGAVWLDGTFHLLSTGSWVRIPRGVPHATVTTDPDGITLACFFPHPDLDSNLDELDIAVPELEAP